MSDNPVKHSIDVHGMSYLMGRYHPKQPPTTVLSIWDHELTKHLPELLNEIYKEMPDSGLDVAISGAAVGLAMHVISIHEMAHSIQALQSFQHSHN